jgi:hypothetical protein
VAYELIVGVDPGGTTGLSILDLKTKTAWVGMQYSPWVQFCDVMEDRCFGWEGLDALIATEKYVITKKTATLSQQDMSLKVNGVLEWLCAKFALDFNEQMSVSAKKMNGDEKLKDMGLYVPGRSHANDATRHLILAVERTMPRLLDDDTLFGYNGSIDIVRDRSN